MNNNKLFKIKNSIYIENMEKIIMKMINLNMLTNKMNRQLNGL